MFCCYRLLFVTIILRFQHDYPRFLDYRNKLSSDMHKDTHTPNKHSGVTKMLVLRGDRTRDVAAW